MDVKELKLEKQRWSLLCNLLQSLCDRHQIDFAHRYQYKVAAKNDKVLFVFLFDAFDKEVCKRAIDHFAQLGKKVYFLVDSWIDHIQFGWAGTTIFSRPQLFGLTALDGQATKPLDQKKLFNCFINRAESVRQSWFYFLYLKGLLDKGYCSYRLYQSNSRLTDKDLFYTIHKESLSQVPHFNQAFTYLQHLVPFSNFVDGDDLMPLINETKYSLVLDTYAPDDNTGCFYISEKVTRALQAATCNLFFVQKGTLQRMKQIGLEIDQKLQDIDHLPWLGRQQMLLDILEQDAWEVSPDMRYQQARHNHYLLNSWAQKCQTAEFYQDIFESIAGD